jgi:hypothetical protein
LAKGLEEIFFPKPHYILVTQKHLWFKYDKFNFFFFFFPSKYGLFGPFPPLLGRQVAKIGEFF